MQLLLGRALLEQLH